jgi:hypothetical protein
MEAPAAGHKQESWCDCLALPTVSTRDQLTGKYGHAGQHDINPTKPSILNDHSYRQRLDRDNDTLAQRGVSQQLKLTFNSRDRTS